MVIGCQNEDDARNLLAALTERLRQFGLAIHEGKTRLIAFGRRIARQRELAGARRPETFDFLGFTPTATRPEADGSRSRRRPRPNVWSAS